MYSRPRTVQTYSHQYHRIPEESSRSLILEESSQTLILEESSRGLINIIRSQNSLVVLSFHNSPDVLFTRRVQLYSHQHHRIPEESSCSLILEESSQILILEKSSCSLINIIRSQNSLVVLSF